MAIAISDDNHTILSRNGDFNIGLLNHSTSKAEYNFPQAMAVSSVAIGETIAGFTLAEVLITLIIIGVVASLVIPNLIQETQDAELKVAWKKQYGVLSQATMRILAENGGSFKGIANTFDMSYLRDQYLQYMSYVKKCNTNGSYGDCWHTHSATSGTDKYLNGQDIGRTLIPLGNGNAGVILNDGTYILFSYEDNSCTSNDSALHQSGNNEGITNLCGWLTVDVNGQKSPNRVGKDIFGVWLTENGIVPYGVKNLSNTCNSSSTGLGCSALYLSQ